MQGHLSSKEERHLAEEEEPSHLQLASEEQKTGHIYGRD